MPLTIVHFEAARALLSAARMIAAEVREWREDARRRGEISDEEYQQLEHEDRAEYEEVVRRSRERVAAREAQAQPVDSAPDADTPAVEENENTTPRTDPTG